MTFSFESFASIGESVRDAGRPACGDAALLAGADMVYTGKEGGRECLEGSGDAGIGRKGQTRQASSDDLSSSPLPTDDRKEQESRQRFTPLEAGWVD